MAANPLDHSPDKPSRFQRFEWRAQRIGWLVFFGIVVAALAGLLGDGPLSRVTRESADGRLRVDGRRFLHYRTHDELRIEVEHEDPSANELEVSLTSEFLDRIEVVQITPQPVSEQTANGRCTFVFDVGQSPRSVIHFHFEPDRWGTLDGQLQCGNSVVELASFVYP